jgi:hypothetical protein
VDPDPKLAEYRCGKNHTGSGSVQLRIWAAPDLKWIWSNTTLKNRWDLTTVLRIRNKSFGSCFGSGSGLKLVSDPDPVSDPYSNPDSNPDSNPGSGSRSETGKKIFYTKIFTQPHLQGCPPSALWLCYEQSAQNIGDLWGSHTDINAYCLFIVSLPHAGEHKV